MQNCGSFEDRVRDSLVWGNTCHTCDNPYVTRFANFPNISNIWCTNFWERYPVSTDTRVVNASPTLWPLSTAPALTPWQKWPTADALVRPSVGRRTATQLECVFCKNNDEPPHVYRSHVLKDPECRITCPVLRAYDCPICHNGGGDDAHTVRYCPLNRAGIHVKMECVAKSTDPKDGSGQSATRSVHSSSHTSLVSKDEPKRNRRKRRAFNNRH